MKVGIIGLGKIGLSVAYRLINASHEVFGFDVDVSARSAASSLGVHMVDQVQELCVHVHVIWFFLPAGSLVDSVLEQLEGSMHNGDIIIDGGNSNFHDSMNRAVRLAQIDKYLLDCGTSGGVHGKELGFCLMVGGDKTAFDRICSMMMAIAAPGGLAHVGPSGAGHYVKMVHNGIEYGMLQAVAEGLNLLKNGSFKKEKLDLEEITSLWQNGSIIRSWILELTHRVLINNPELSGTMGVIEQTGTGRWAVEDAEKNDVPVPVLMSAIKVREKSSSDGGNFATKLVAMLRHEFGGHRV